ncbi:MAG: hypothetical protein QOI73_1762 [Solirubrobacteraceae bacterium]|nr:hypothetical protein [Solirubrobacteraceae bacterium]
MDDDRQKGGEQLLVFGGIGLVVLMIIMAIAVG